MLTREQRSQYEEQGYVHLPGAFDRRAAEAVAERVWEYLEAERGVLQGDRATWDVPGAWVGLKTLREPTPEGLGVVEAVADYPFGKAGVTAGDHIVEFGHSEVRSLHDIVRRLVSLRHGSEAIVRVRRDGALVDLVMTVE